MALQPPKSLKQLRSFMGILNHMSRFIPNLQKHTEPFRPSLKGDNKKKFIWSEEANNAFQKTLELIANITKMHHYDATKQCRIKCDASHKGFGAALGQELEPDKWVPIAFTSRFLNAAEQKYSTNELELLAVVCSCEFFRNCLLGNQFQILTDHKAIVTALTENRGNKTYQSRLTRWADRMLPFEYTISHIAGAKIVMADYLSRSPKFEAPPTSKYDEQFVVKAIENFDEACRVINTPAPTEQIGQIQIVRAYLEEDRINSKRIILIGKERGGKHPISDAPQGGVDILYKEFIQSDLRCRTARSNVTCDTEGNINQSGSDMQMFTHPQEGASSCRTVTNQSNQNMQIHIPQVQIGKLCGKNNNQSKQDMQTHNSPREGGKSCGENFNQSDSSNVNLFTTSPHLTSSPREGAVTKSNQSEAMELYSAKNIQKSMSPILNLNHTSSNKSIINSSKHNFQRKMSKFILPSIKQMESSIEE